MTKPQKVEGQNNKEHKTLRDKLKKRREQDKKHKKEKKLKKKQYDPTLKKNKFFQQRNFESKQGEINQKKITKHIKKFINIYEDDLEDFFGVFESFDNKQQIDIENVENIPLRKCFKKMFKYLPLKKTKMLYQKRQTLTNLNSYMRNKISAIMENYLEYGSGTDSEKLGDRSSSEQVQQSKSLKIIKEQKKPEVIEPQFQLKNKKIQEGCMGPFITAQQRLRIQEVFSKQIHKQNEQLENGQNEEFQKIFAMSSQRNHKSKTKKIEEVPAHLMAEGSAKLGQRLDIDEDYLEKYNRQFRPKKLIQQHRELMSEGNMISQKKDRKPFDRERDIVKGGAKQTMMNNGVFFDFKDRMTKPKNTNTFL